MPFDYKKEYKEFYLPPKNPTLVEVPPMNYIAVRGSGDPNAQDGLYRHSVGLLYATAFTLKMSDRGPHRIDGYFPYVVPPLEGFWWQEGIAGVDYAHKEAFQWICAIRLPDLCGKPMSAGLLKKLPERKSRIFHPWNSSLTRKVSLSSACTSALTMMSLQRSARWMRLPSRRAASRISATAVFTMKFTSAILANATLPGSEPSCGIPYGGSKAQNRP